MLVLATGAASTQRHNDEFLRHQTPSSIAANASNASYIDLWHSRERGVAGQREQPVALQLFDNGTTDGEGSEYAQGFGSLLPDNQPSASQYEWNQGREPWGQGEPPPADVVTDSLPDGSAAFQDDSKRHRR